ncbi:putative leucine-rich repeat-containing protein DDB_G0290503 [Pectinophora gossypiella]|uniref:putative leucine-rich repeat-containing protein DDB_G0290503 n=1 Tax=Pectinophora gossypiella TaxID=13191 RepID=UPI00214ECDA7|nr:putative leucine-rich repeat-containing protein DDB_G0290503 [Pectinophora gossypiella]
MALRWTRVWWLAVAVLLWTPHAHSREVTHEDIRDAMMSLVHMFRSSQDKLERHEYREKVLGDQVKKMLTGLEKKHRALEPLKGMLSRLDERLSNVETILLQKEEREKATQKKTDEALDGIQKSLQSLTASLPKNLKPGGSVVEDNLTTNEDGSDKKRDATDAKLDAVKTEIDNLKNSLSKDSLRSVCLAMVSEVNPLEKHISEAEKLLTRYELKLNEFNGTKVQTDFVPLSEVTLADEAWHSKMSEVMERQEKEIQKIQQLLTDAESMWKDLPRVADLTAATNRTLDAVQQAKNELKENDDASVGKVSTKLREMSDRLVGTNEDIQRSLTQGNTMTEHAYNDISRSYETLRTEVQTLSKNEHVMLQTADNVIANKKRIEYGVHQILVEVGELIKMQGKNLNRTINDRFDNIETTIVENQTGALTNLSSKIESEMSQVWRQIGIMYQQLTASKMSLDKLTEQTEQYVNGSATTMDNMKDKVGLITTRMTEVDDNLNYLLGRLSLVAQEFNQIKTGLGDALDKVKASFLTVQSRLDDAGPGPHNITSAEKTT